MIFSILRQGKRPAVLVKNDRNSQVRVVQAAVEGKTVDAIRNPTVVLVAPGTRPNVAVEVS